MNRLIMHHAYKTGLAWDRSPFRNHGQPVNVNPSGSALHFNGANSDVRVETSKSLQELRSIWVGCTFGLQALGGGGARRFNLVEGHLSFALFITPQLSLQGTFHNPDNQWVGVESPPATILPNQSYSVAFYYDGVSSAALQVNGAVVAVRHDLHGPVRGVGPLGVHVGRWPDADQYVFQGKIGEVKLFKEAPTDLARDLADPCCFDEKRLRETLDGLRKAGHTREDLPKWYDRLRELAAESRRGATGGDPARTEVVRKHTRDIWDSFVRRDKQTLIKRLQQWQGSGLLSEDSQNELIAKATKFVDDAPLSLEEIFRLAEGICGLDVLLCALLTDRKGNTVTVERVFQEAEKAGVDTKKDKPGKFPDTGGYDDDSGDSKGKQGSGKAKPKSRSTKKRKGD